MVAVGGGIGAVLLVRMTRRERRRRVGTFTGTVGGRIGVPVLLVGITRRELRRRVDVFTAVLGGGVGPDKSPSSVFASSVSFGCASLVSIGESWVWRWLRRRVDASTVAVLGGASGVGRSFETSGEAIPLAASSVVVVRGSSTRGYFLAGISSA